MFWFILKGLHLDADQLKQSPQLSIQFLTFINIFLQELKPRQKEIHYWPHWHGLPEPIKINVASFLNRREVTMLAKISKCENANKIKYLCASFSNHPEQIKTTDDLTILIAQLLKLKFTDISKSETFETLMIRLIQKLSPEQVPFLSANADITNQAHYNYFRYNNRVVFQFKQYTKEQNSAMAKVLENYFPGIHTKVVQLKENQHYHFSMDAKSFFQQVLPCIFGVVAPQKKIPIHEPEIIDWEPPKPVKPGTMQTWFVKRIDGLPMTQEDKENVYYAINPPKL